MNPDRATAILQESGVDAIVVTRPENVRYVSDLRLDLPISLELPVAVIVSRDPLGAAEIIAPRVIAGSVAESQIAGPLTSRTAIRLYGRFHALAHHRDRLSEMERGTLDLLEMAPGEGRTFEEALGDALGGLPRSMHIAWDDPRVGLAATHGGWVPHADGSLLMRRIRRVKSPDEVERLRRAAEIAEEVELEVVRAAVPGSDWATVIGAIGRLVAERGAVFGFFTGGAGWQSGFVYPPGTHRLSRGELVRLDIGLSFDGYWADTGRTASLGEPSPIARTRYQAIRAAVESTLELIRPGVPLATLYETAMAEARRAIPDHERHHCGHAIGLRAYDGDLVAPGDTTALETGMTLNIEVPYYEIGWGGLQLEETVVVEPGGFRPLTTLPRDIIVTGA